jgi:hypothetical protein
VAPRPDLIISADIEADGPIPGPYSMLSFGFSVVGVLRPDGVLERHDPRAATFYRELRPISDEFVASALAVGGLDRHHLVAHGADPAEAMGAAHDWVVARAEEAGARPVLVSWPLVFDWMFLHWYFERFGPSGDPFRHSNALDAKTLAFARLQRPLDLVQPDALPAHVRSDQPHTHHALDDAVEQGEVFANLYDWRP